MKACAVVLGISCLFLLGLFTDVSNKVHGSVMSVPSSENQVVETKWSGTVRQTTKFFGDMPSTEMSSEATLEVSFNQAIPSLYRRRPVDDTSTLTDNKGSGTFVSKGNSKLIGPKGVVSVGHSDCFGIGPSELHSVIINSQAGKYDIEVMGPDSKCKSETTLIPTGDVTKSDYDAGSGEPGNSITISQQTLGKNQNVLTGSISESFTNPGIGHGTRAITWNLTREVINAEFIITPANYDTWLPEPGLDLSTSYKGNVMEVDLKVQRIGGGAPSHAVKRFELSLIATSEEPGITINYPVNIGSAPIPGSAVVPTAYLPDLRFIVNPSALSVDDDQTIKIESQNGSTGKAYIAAYDGGAYSNLVGEAVLENGIRLKGHLRVASGPITVPIPKRSANSKIGEAWLKANGNPADLDDEEVSPNNKLDGDGLSAYEEYRGVIVKGSFQRLDPQKKELGAIIKPAELPLFSGGLGLFENASGIKTLVFSPEELPENRRLNNNAATAHIFDQFALRIYKGDTAQPDPSGQVRRSVFGYAYPRVGIPAHVTHIVIDVDLISLRYNNWASVLGAANVPGGAESDWRSQTVAHEIGHGVDLSHHGVGSTMSGIATAPPPAIRIFNTGNTEIIDRPFTLQRVAAPGNQASGNVSCIMTYNNKFPWLKLLRPDGSLWYLEVPNEPAMQTTYCLDQKGTGINANAGYFSDASANAECMRHIRLK